MTQEYRRIDCPKCKKRLKIKPDWNPEKNVKCPKCENSFRINADSPSKAANEPQLAVSASSNKLAIIAISTCGIVILAIGIIMGSKFFGSSNPKEETAQVEQKGNNADPSSGNAKSKPAANEEQKPDGNPTQKSESQTQGQTLKASKSHKLEAPNPVNRENDENDRPEKKKIDVEPGITGLGLTGEVKGGLDDPNRPKFKPAGEGPAEFAGQNGSGLGQPNGLSNSAFQGSGVTGGQTQGGVTGEVPSLNVLIEPEIKSSSVMRVDYQADPGISAKFSVSLDETPITTITIKITTEQGMTVDKETLTFAKNTQPKRQTVTISGDGKANLDAGPAKILYMTVTASGGGFDSTGPAKVPVEVVKRSGFVVSNGNWLTRGDVTGQGEKSQWFNAAFPRVPATGTADYYTDEFVEMLGPLGQRRMRFYDDRIELESAPNSGTFNFLTNGNWY